MPETPPPSVALVIPPLATDEIHVWTVSPLAAPEQADALATCLSPHERHRAARMRHTDHRRAFTVGRARVRQVLGAYVGQPPAEVDVVTRVDDRPTLTGAPRWFDFSFSRCEGIHVCAIARDRRLGIDVEPVSMGAQHTEASQADVSDTDIFSPDDLAWLAAQPVERRAVARAEIWTKKEAFAKAVGGPMPLLRAVHVPRTGDGIVTGTDQSLPRQGPWLLRCFWPSPAISGAVAAEGSWRLTLLPYPP